jgi:hypothetical protein
VDTSATGIGHQSGATVAAGVVVASSFMAPFIELWPLSYWRQTRPTPVPPGNLRGWLIA